MNNVVWKPIDDFWEHKSEIAGVQRSTQYNGRNNGIGIHMTHLQGVCCVIAAEVLPPNVRLCRAVPLPQPDWEDAPNPRIRWWAVNPDGRQVWGEGKAACPRGYWRGIDDRGLSFPFYVVAGDKIDLPLGIDWRLTLVERPQEEPA